MFLLKAQEAHLLLEVVRAKMRSEEAFPMNIIGALGWFYHGKVLKKSVHPSEDLALSTC
jgi:hypothetical protein